VDQPPKIDLLGKDKTEEEKVIYEEHPWPHYFGTTEVTKIIHKKFKCFSALIGIYYLVQFVCCVATASYYSDYERYNRCDYMGDKSLEEYTAVYDRPLLLLFVFHILEWLRTTTLLTSVCIGVNLVHVWYITILNSFFGLGVYIYVHTVRYNIDGVACAVTQEGRATWLLVEIILFWCLFFFFAFPLMTIRCCMKK